MPTKVTRTAGAALPPSCGALYVLDVSDPANPTCKLAVTEVGVIAPAAAAGLVVAGGLHLLKAPIAASLGVGGAVLLGITLFLAMVRSNAALASV